LQLLISRLHDTTGCQLVEQLSNRLNNRVGLFVYTMQPVVQPVVGCTMTAVQPVVHLVECLYTRYNWLCNRYVNPLENWLHRVDGVLG